MISCGSKQFEPLKIETHANYFDGTPFGLTFYTLDNMTYAHFNGFIVLASTFTRIPIKIVDIDD